MNNVSSTRRAQRRQSQDGSADKVVVNLEASSPAVVSHHQEPAAGARNSPIDVEAIEEEVQAVSPSQVPPQLRNKKRRKKPVTVVDLEVEASQEGNKRQRAAHVDAGAGSSLQSNNAANKEPAKEPPREPILTCPVCWNKLEDACTTICGHIFCSACIKQAIKSQKKCPTCRKYLRQNNFHRIYLPNSSS